MKFTEFYSKNKDFCEEVIYKMNWIINDFDETYSVDLIEYFENFLYIFVKAIENEKIDNYDSKKIITFMKYINATDKWNVTKDLKKLEKEYKCEKCYTNWIDVISILTYG